MIPYDTLFFCPRCGGPILALRPYEGVIVRISPHLRLLGLTPASVPIGAATVQCSSCQAVLWGKSVFVNRRLVSIELFVAIEDAPTLPWSGPEPFMPLIPSRHEHNEN